MGYEVARHWRLKQERYLLVGSKCKECGQLDFPPRSVCRNQHGETPVNAIEVKGGEIFSGELLLLAPREFPRLPDNQVVHRVVERQYQENDYKRQDKLS